MIKKIFISISFIITLVGWEYLSQSNNDAKILISSPTLILQYLNANWNDLFIATTSTTFIAFIGLLIATIFAFSFMTLCFYRPKLLKLLMPFMISSQIIPIIILAPFMVNLFGIGYSSKIALASVIAFFPIFLNFHTGYKSIPQNIIDSLKINNASIHFKIFKVYYPLSLPNIFTGLKLSSNLSVLGALVAEWTGAKNGLGKNLFLTSIRIDPELMMSSLFLSSLVGGLMFLIVYLLERKIGTWYLK